MIRFLLLNPVMIALAAAVGVWVCRAMGADAHLHEMIIAAGICLAATELAAVPTLIQQRKPQVVTAFQAALVGTVVHLGVVLLSAIVVILALQPPRAFVYWLLPLYWLTLIGLCTAFAILLRVPVQPESTKV